MKTIYFYLIIVISVIAFSCGNKKGLQENVKNSVVQDTEVEISEQQYNTVQIITGRVEEKELSGTIKVNGMLDVPPQQKVSITFPFGGFLKSTELLQGMKVNKGQLIARIENPEFIQVQQDYMDVKSQLDYAKNEYERQQALAADKVNALKTLQQSKSNYYSLLAKFKGLSARLGMMNINPVSVEDGNFTSVVNIYSPISGFVTKINANIGMYLNPSDVVFELVDTRHLHVELSVFEDDVNQLKIGDKVIVTLANETTNRTATVYLVGKEIREDRTISVHCHLDNEDVDLIPGTFLKANVETGKNKVTAVPDAAIVKYQGKSYVFIEKSKNGENHRFEMKEVMIGEDENGYTQVLTLLNEHAMIVTNGAYDLLAQMKNDTD